MAELNDLPLGGGSVLKKPDWEGACGTESAEGLVTAEDWELVGADAADWELVGAGAADC